jgi:hypothetical protein
MHCCGLADYLTGLLPIKAWLAWARACFSVRDCHAGYKTFICHMNNGIRIKVAKMAMLKV